MLGLLWSINHHSSNKLHLHLHFAVPHFPGVRAIELSTRLREIKQRSCVSWKPPHCQKSTLDISYYYDEEIIQLFPCIVTSGCGLSPWWISPWHNCSSHKCPCLRKMLHVTYFNKIFKQCKQEISIMQSLNWYYLCVIMLLKKIVNSSWLSFLICLLWWKV